MIEKMSDESDESDELVITPRTVLYSKRKAVSNPGPSVAKAFRPPLVEYIGQLLDMFHAWY